MTNEEIAEHVDSRIIKATLANDRLYLYLAHGVQLIISDNAQSCCERRYMVCDDNVQDLVGSMLKDIELRDGGKEETGNENDLHETSFVHVITDTGSVVLCTHNEHNGYYGGFGIEIEQNAVWKWKPEDHGEEDE
jgi:hypothetical protein